MAVMAPMVCMPTIKSSHYKMIPLLLTRKALFFYLFLVTSSSVWAAKWELTPSASATYTYSDNITLAQSNRSGDAALSLNPRIQVRGEGGRIDLAANYGLQVFRYRDNTQADDEYHSADFVANFKLLPDTFHVETNARYGQQAISLSSSPVPQNNAAITSNRTNSLSYQIKPTYKSRLGSTAAFQADYSYDGVQYDDNSIQERHVRNTSYHFGLSSTKAYRDLSWSLDHNRTDFGVQGDSNDYYSNTDLTLRYLIMPKLSLIASGGDEQNNVTNSQLGDGDTYWSGGFAWTPTSRTSVEVTRGERFFGNTTTASITSAGKRSSFNLTYDESITTISSIQADTNLIPGFVVLSIADDFILQEALHATLSANTAKTDYGLTVDKRKITYQTTINREDYSAYSVFWNWRISPRSSINLSGTRQVTDFITTKQKLILDSHEISFDRTIGNRGSSSLRYIHYENESSTGSNEYQSDFYEFTLTWSFR